jgi:hypothetical protein
MLCEIQLTMGTTVRFVLRVLFILALVRPTFDAFLSLFANPISASRGKVRPYTPLTRPPVIALLAG